MRQAFVCDSLRTPIARYGGALAAVRPDDLLALVIAALVRRNAGLDPQLTDDVIVGCANQSGEDNRNVARMSALLAGLPQAVPGATINRLCGSGLDAIVMAARSIIAGGADLVIAGGVESMSRAPFVMAKSEAAFDRSLRLEDTTIGWRFVNSRMRDLHGVHSMPETAENVALAGNISREAQDAFALRSQQRARLAIESGLFADEILPVSVPMRDGTIRIFDADEHPRATSQSALARLKPIVRIDGTVTAGNSSGVNDGACAVIIASEEAIVRHRLVPVARFVDAAVAGVAPALMGLGPVPATARLLARTRLSIDAMDVIELNEAFAAQAVASLRQLGVPEDAAHVNPNGGAIALGHPLGMSGARLVTTAVRQMNRTGGRLALCTMCIGVGQGIAALFEHTAR